MILRRGIPFATLEKDQERLRSLVAQSSHLGCLLISEPLPTFTAGRSAERYELLWSDPKCQESGVTIASVSRGGRWTYHGPGQWVVYPIIKLKDLGFHQKDAKRYTNRLAHGVLNFVQSFCPHAHFQENPFGIFVGTYKIASFGIELKEGVSTHGVAIYLENPTPYTSGIIACGVEKQSFTSLREWGFSGTWENGAQLLSDAIKKGLIP